MSLHKTFTLAAILFVGIANLSSGQDLKPTNSWSGVHNDSALADKMPTGGLIFDGKSFKTVWKAWMADEKIPDVDFNKDFVYVLKIKGPNRPSLFLSTVNQKSGDLSVYASSTKKGGPGFGFLLLQFPRNKVKSVSGRKIPRAPKRKTEGVTVTVVGKLTHGVMAIGGETTGTTIKANNIVFELQLKDEKQRKLADTNNGKMVEVSGQLTLKRGVERGNRWIVVVRSISPQK